MYLFLYIKYKEMQHYRTDITNQAKRSKTTVIKTDTWFSKRYRKCIEAIICDDSLCMYYNLVSMHVFTTSYVYLRLRSLYTPIAWRQIPIDLIFLSCKICIYYIPKLYHANAINTVSLLLFRDYSRQSFYSNIAKHNCGSH